MFHENLCYLPTAYKPLYGLKIYSYTLVRLFIRVRVLLKPGLENLFVSALFLVAASRGYTSVALSRPLIVVASLVTQHGL